MDWYNASTWCEARGRHLASLEEMCPGWDGETGSDKCANLYDIGAPDSWSSQTFSSSEAYCIRSGNGTVTYEYWDTYLKAFCY